MPTTPSTTCANPPPSPNTNTPVPAALEPTCETMRWAHATRALCATTAVAAAWAGWGRLGGRRAARAVLEAWGG